MSHYVKRDVPFELVEIDLQHADNKKLIQISRELGIALNLTEMKLVKNYFSRKKRNPTDVELQTIGQTWSEHCYHKTFKGDIATPEGEIRSLFKTFIAKATEELAPSWCISVFEDNAGIIAFDGNHAIAAKVETHNHPSASVQCHQARPIPYQPRAARRPRCPSGNSWASDPRPSRRTTSTCPGNAPASLGASRFARFAASAGQW